jgi:hypothetical protein
MMIKKNDLGLKEFVDIDWRKEKKSLKNNQLHNQILAWLLNPYGDHGLEARFLESFVLKAGLKREVAKLVILLGHNNDLTDYDQEARATDVVLETEKGYLLIENRTTLIHGEADRYLKELKAKADWFKDSLRRNKVNRILLLMPSAYMLSPLADYVKRSTFVVPMTYQRVVDIIGEMLLYDIHYNTHKKFYNALERYRLFLETYVVDIYDDEQLKARLENLNAII